jgi:hypothetical protein
MDIAVDDRYFTALSAVISARLGAEHPCALAATKAARVPKPENVKKARAELDRLDPAIRSELDDELERWMHEDF